MEILINPYIAKYSLGVDTLTGLNKEIQATSFYVDAKKRQITVEWEIVLVTTTGAVMNLVERGFYVRSGLSYDGLQASGIGQGIIGLLTSTLSAYPNI